MSEHAVPDPQLFEEADERPTQPGGRRVRRGQRVDGRWAVQGHIDQGGRRLFLDAEVALEATPDGALHGHGRDPLQGRFSVRARIEGGRVVCAMVVFGETSALLAGTITVRPRRGVGLKGAWSVVARDGTLLAGPCTWRCLD